MLCFLSASGNVEYKGAVVESAWFGFRKEYVAWMLRKTFRKTSLLLKVWPPASYQTNKQLGHPTRPLNVFQIQALIF